MTLIPEWLPQSTVLLTWPHADTDWQPILARVSDCYCEIVAAITCFQSCLIICRDDAHQTDIQAQLNNLAAEQLARIDYVQVPYDDTWIRDYGPLSMFSAEGLTLADFTFNAWGDKFSANRDNAVTQAIAHKLPAPVRTVDLILEGGSIETDGQGSVMTTSQCLLSPTRNAQLSISELDEALRTALGVKQILWLNHGHLAGDDTDAHIDTLARFCPNNVICYQACDDENDAHYPALQRMAQELAYFSNANGEPYQLIALPWPKAIYADDGHRLPASYANYLVINGAVLVPIYNDANDVEAMHAVGKAYHSHEIIGIDCTALIEQHGSLHCATMQISSPANK